MDQLPETEADVVRLLNAINHSRVSDWGRIAENLGVLMQIANAINIRTTVRSQTLDAARDFAMFFATDLRRLIVGCGWEVLTASPDEFADAPPAEGDDEASGVANDAACSI